VRGSARTLALLLATLGCSQDEPRDELDAAVIDELAAEQGSASGVAWTGSYSSTFMSDSCDCPTVTIQDAPVDLCSLVEQVSLQLDLVQADGFLVATTTETMLTGAIAADGEFVIAGRANLATVLGPIDRLSRMDGILELVAGDARLSATAGQRLIGEFAGEAIDCRWLGRVEAVRIE
jgi:hypothetical protein